MKIKQKNKKGFTLVELLASIVILGIIMMIALVSVDEVNEKSALSASISSAKNYIRGIEYKYMSNPTEDVQVYRVDNNNVSDYVISKKIYYYNDGKRKSWNDIDKEIKEVNDKLLEWVVSLSDNN